MTHTHVSPPVDTFRGKRLTIFGCGYIGLAVARQALARGMKVAALTRNPQTAAVVREAGVTEVVVADLHDEAWHGKLCPQTDYLLNCVSSAGGGLEGYRISYLRGQESILQWLRQGYADTYVYTGATSVYPQSDGSWVDETAPHDGMSANAAVLLESEALLAHTHAGPGRWFVLRLAGIYGPGRHYLLDRLRQGTGSFPGSGDSYLNLIHRDDCVAAVWAAFAAPAQLRNRVYNVADGNPARKRDLCAWLAQTAGALPPVFDTRRVSSRDAGRKDADGKLPNRRVDVARIRRELGWQPRYADFTQGFKAILEAPPTRP